VIRHECERMGIDTMVGHGLPRLRQESTVILVAREDCAGIVTALIDVVAQAWNDRPEAARHERTPEQDPY